MKLISVLYSTLLLSLCLSCNSGKVHTPMLDEIESYVSAFDARIGIAVITGKDTLSLHGGDQFPMMSVYKFPIAMAVAEHCRNNGLSTTDSITVTAADLHTDTYSPMLDKYAGTTATAISIHELLAYSLQQSDNNASDILLAFIGGADIADTYMKKLGIEGMTIKWTEDEMHIDNSRSYENSSSPLAMASLLDKFDRLENDSISTCIKSLMENCATGTDRIPAPLSDSAIVVGHKTGTGFTLPSGRLMALNDAAYVHLPDGRNYTLVVFIADTSLDATTAAEVIAGISSIVKSHMDHSSPDM